MNATWPDGTPKSLDNAFNVKPLEMPLPSAEGKELKVRKHGPMYATSKFNQNKSINLKKETK